MTARARWCCSQRFVPVGRWMLVACTLLLCQYSCHGRLPTGVRLHLEEGSAARATLSCPWHVGAGRTLRVFVRLIAQHGTARQMIFCLCAFVWTPAGQPRRTAGSPRAPIQGAAQHRRCSSKQPRRCSRRRWCCWHQDSQHICVAPSSCSRCQQEGRQPCWCHQGRQSCSRRASSRHVLH